MTTFISEYRKEYNKHQISRWNTTDSISSLPTTKELLKEVIIEEFKEENLIDQEEEDKELL